MKIKLLVLVAALLVSRVVQAQTFSQVVPVPENQVSYSTLTVVFPRPTSLPCTLFLVGWNNTEPTITDDAGDVWEKPSRGLWYTQCKSRVSKVTLTFSPADRFYGVLGEKAGYFDADITSLTVDGNTNPTNSATITTTSADLIIGYGWNYTTSTPTMNPGSGYVMEGQGGAAFLEDWQQTAPGPVSSSVTYTGGWPGYNGWQGWWVQGVVAFKPAIPSFCTCGH